VGAYIPPDPIVVNPRDCVASFTNWCSTGEILEATDDDWMPVVPALDPIEPVAPVALPTPIKPVVPKEPVWVDCDGAARCEPDSKTEPEQYKRWKEAYVRNGSGL